MTERRVSVEEAAVLLGISRDAVRARIRHGTLRSEKTDDMIRVWLGEDPASDRYTVHSRPRVEASPRETAEDIEELRAQVRHLREILAEERGVAGREDRIIAQLTRANASLAPVVLEPGTPAPPVRPEPVEPAEAKTSQPQRAEPERRGPWREARKGVRSARSQTRSAARAPGGGDGSAAEGGEVGAGSRESHRRTKAASRKGRLERRLESLKRRQRRPEPISALKLLTTEEIRRALVLTDRAGVLPNGDVRRPEAFQEASPEELEAFSHWRKLCGEPLDHVELAEELLDRMGEAHSWRSPEALTAAQFLQRLERPDRSPWFVAKMAEAVLNFYAEMGQYPDEPQHPRVRGAVRRLERLKEIGLRDRTEPPEDSGTAGGPAP